MQQAPPPLPPKMRSRISISSDAPPAAGAAATVPQMVGGGTVSVRAPDVFALGFPEVHAAGSHVVTIKINPENGELRAAEPQPPGCIRISVGSADDDMVRPRPTEPRTEPPSEPPSEPAAEPPAEPAAERAANPYFFCGLVMSSGQCSPSDTLDSGTCSDLDSTPPPAPTKKRSPAVTTVTIVGAHHKRAGSLASSGADVDSDDEGSNISCDSLNSSELNADAGSNKPATPDVPEVPELPPAPVTASAPTAAYPQGLLKDIRDRPPKPPGDVTVAPAAQPTIVSECTYEERQQEQHLSQLGQQLEQLEQRRQRDARPDSAYLYETDKYYKFHLNEQVTADEQESRAAAVAAADDETFAGYRDLLGPDGSSTIRSAKGTVRGVKNRVRAGIATFLQINSPEKSYKEKDAGKVVVYTTTMGIVRSTYHQCVKVKQILRTHLVKFEERDVFMSGECQSEIRERMRCDQILVPQVFVDGQHVGDAETIERLNESGELRRILKPYKSADACTTCSACGGYRLLPCPVCNGSKKSVHRNNFTNEFVALKCMNCDEVGLVRCGVC